jgi:hypothetical protein
MKKIKENKNSRREQKPKTVLCLSFYGMLGWSHANYGVAVRMHAELRTGGWYKGSI